MSYIEGKVTIIFRYMQIKSLKSPKKVPFGIESGELFGCKAVRDGNVARSFGVDTLHFLTEKAAVGRGVAEMVDSDVIMDHLMEDGVFDKVFRQVNTDVDTEDEVIIMRRTKEP